MNQFLQNADYLRPETWVRGDGTYAINKTVVSRNQTLLSDHLLPKFLEHARIDSGTEQDMCRFLLAASIESIEHHTGLTLAPTERQWGVRNWVPGTVMQIDGQPVQTIVVDDNNGNDITTQCEVNATVQDTKFYLRVPEQYKDFNIVFGSGMYADVVDFNIWQSKNVWGLLNCWSPVATIDENPLLRLAILTIATDFYQNRESSTDRQHYRIPSVVEHVLRPLHRPPGY